MHSFSWIVSFALNNAVTTFEVLNGQNFKKWKADIEFYLGVADLDLALRVDVPDDLTEESSDEEKKYYQQWERSNRLALMTMKRTTAEHLMSGLPETENAKDFLTAVGERYQISNNAETGDLMSELTGMKYDKQGGVRDYILKMVHVQTKLQSRKVSIPDSFIIHHALNSLPLEFSHIKTAYNTQKESWTINDLITHCVAEENKIKSENHEVALLVSKSEPHSDKVSTSKFKGHAHKKVQGFKRGGKGQKQNQKHNVGGPRSAVNKFDQNCYFCKRKGHKRAQCTKYKVWLERKKTEEGNSLAYVCLESNLVDVPSNTWWIDSGATVHVAISLQGFKTNGGQVN